MIIEYKLVSSNLSKKHLILEPNVFIAQHIAHQLLPSAHNFQNVVYFISKAKNTYIKKKSFKYK